VVVVLVRLLMLMLMLQLVLTLELMLVLELQLPQLGWIGHAWTTAEHHAHRAGSQPTPPHHEAPGARSSRR
tara:strand:+ start:382 stop:594 length:213 start_codon:yes stop_codon:yes gene_type:complete